MPNIAGHDKTAAIFTASAPVSSIADDQHACSDSDDRPVFVKHDAGSSRWAARQWFVLGQQTAEEKSNDVTAIPSPDRPHTATSNPAPQPRPLTSTSLTAEIITGSTGHHVPLFSLHTPVGDLSVAEDDGAIVSVDWGWGRDQDETALLRRARQQLDAYFDLALTTFDLPLAPVGSPYRQRVWQALLAIPYGATRSYLDIAREAGGSPRSVGGANGANPIPIIIPCHRVVATTGIGGYSGGDGLPTKRALLALENPRWDYPLGENLQATLI